MAVAAREKIALPIMVLETMGYEMIQQAVIQIGF
jgi:hypothetical protein